MGSALGMLSGRMHAVLHGQLQRQQQHVRWAASLYAALAAARWPGAVGCCDRALRWFGVWGGGECSRIRCKPSRASHLMCLCVGKGARQEAALGEAGQPRTAESPCKNEGRELACRSRTRTASQCRERSRASPWLLPFGREQRQQQIRCVWPPAQIAGLQDREVERFANSVLFALAELPMRDETKWSEQGLGVGRV